MENINTPDIRDYNVFNSVCESLLKDLVQNLMSESEFISLMPIALEGKIGRGKVAYERFCEANKTDVFEYWHSVCSQLQLKAKHNILQSLIKKYADVKETSRPNLDDIDECLDICRKNALIDKKQKLEEGLRDLQDELHQIEEECVIKIKKYDENIKLQLGEIRSILINITRNLNESITERVKQITEIDNM